MTLESSAQLVYPSARLSRLPEPTVILNELEDKWARDVIGDVFGINVTDVHLLRSRPWSSLFLWRLEDGTELVQKVPAAPFQSEAAILDFVRSYIAVAPVIATHESGAFLMAKCAGESLRVRLRQTLEYTRLVPPAALLSRAQAQMGSGTFPEQAQRISSAELEGVALEAFAGRGGSLAGSERVLRALAYLFDRFGESIEHGDFQDNNILIVNGEYTFLDWGDASITCPVFSLATYVHASRLAHRGLPESVVSNVVTAYLREWGTDVGDAGAVLEACHVTYPLLGLVHAARMSQCGGAARMYGQELQSYWTSVLVGM
jgi:hypothetical protein